MKKAFKNLLAVLFLSAVITGCHDDITLDGTLSGIISNYSKGSFDAIQCTDAYTDDDVIGNGTPTSSGKFNMQLSTPALNSTTPATGISMSDINARIGQLGNINIKLQGATKGQLFKCNNIFDGYSDLDGMELASYMYSDRACTITGKVTNDGTTYTYDLKLKKGWNEVMLKKVSGTSQTMTTKIADDLEWRCFFYSAQDVKKYKLPSLN